MKEYYGQPDFLKDFLIKVDKIAEEREREQEKDEGLSKACANLFGLFNALTKSGFTDEQAMHLVETMLKEGFHR